MRYRVEMIVDMQETHGPYDFAAILQAVKRVWLPVRLQHYTHKGDYNMKSTETVKRNSTVYLKRNGLEMSLGNAKLGNDTIIFNMGSATNCPSRKLGFCLLGNNCYAFKAENLRKQVKPYRDRQEAYWLGNNAMDIGMDIINALMSRRVRVDGKLVPMMDTIKYFRFNESGDFHSQECVKNLDIIASMLAYYGIVTYGYTARKDLDFTNVNFLVKGSGHDNSNNGTTIARPAATLKAWGVGVIDTRPGEWLREAYIEKGRSYSVCPGDCTICDLCKTPDNNDIVFPLH